MRIYYEAQTVEEEPDFVRIDVTDMNETDRADVLSDITILMGDTVEVHYCGHEDSGDCEWEELK